MQINMLSNLHECDATYLAYLFVENGNPTYTPGRGGGGIVRSAATGNLHAAFC
jgi:hypothetical protein